MALKDHTWDSQSSCAKKTGGPPKKKEADHHGGKKSSSATIFEKVGTLGLKKRDVGALRAACTNRGDKNNGPVGDTFPTGKKGRQSGKGIGPE